MTTDRAQFEVGPTPAELVELESRNPPYSRKLIPLDDSDAANIAAARLALARNTAGMKAPRHE